MQKTNIISEIGINHNGDIDLAKKLITISAFAGCDYVKFQKREPDICVPDSQKSLIRQTPWGEMTYLDYKKKLEFGLYEYEQISDYCQTLGIKWFSSVWDIPSVDFCSKMTKIGKIPSALINDIELVSYARSKFETLLISTGMSTEEEIENAVRAGNPDVIFHTNSTYPSPINELNLNYIKWLKEKYPNSQIGYSGHEFGLVTTFAAVALGATWIERHVTLDREMWGSDQKSSVEPTGIIKLVTGIRSIEESLGDFAPRKLLASEMKKRDSLRK